jgi:hypothetical protein
MDDKGTPREKELHINDLVLPEQSIVAALGLMTIEALKKWKQAVFAVDVLGRVQILRPEAVTIKDPPKVRPGELDQMDEEMAIQVMLAQNDPEQVIVEYLRARENKRG